MRVFYSIYSGIGKLRTSFMNEVNSTNVRKILMEMKMAIDPKNIFGAQNGSFSCITEN